MTTLGDKVTDKVTGFAGVVTVRSEYLDGNPRCGVDALDKDGKPVTGARAWKQRRSHAQFAQGLAPSSHVQPT